MQGSEFSHKKGGVVKIMAAVLKRRNYNANKNNI